MFLFKSTKNKELIVFFLGILLIFIFCFSFNKVFLPLDILNYLPSFSEHSWEKPHNSLLADPLFQFEPWRHYARENIRAFRFPLWNNLNGAGEPFFANPQTAVLFPLNLLYYLLNFKEAINLIILLKVYLFCTFTYLYLKSIGKSAKISLIGSILSTACSFMIVWVQWPHTNVFLFLPLFLFLTERLKEASTLSTKILIVISYFFAILGGHPETLFHITLFHLLYSCIRLWENKRRLRDIFVSISVGFLLGAIQLVPFVEYLINSYAWQNRLWNGQNFLPAYTFIVNVIPFISGAPHLQLYKPLFNINFQELIGSYVGPIILLVVLFNIPYIVKNSLSRLWFVIVILSWGIVYKIWPFWLITYLPFIRNAANTRLSGIAGFGLIILFIIVFDEILQRKIKINTKLCALLFATSLVTLGTLLIFNIFDQEIIKNVKNTYLQKFIPFFASHLFLQLTSSFLFFISLVGFQKKVVHKNIFILISLISILQQSSFLFVSYNTLSLGYYPKVSLVKALNKLPQGKNIEIGNMSFPPELNLIYGIHSVVGNDALFPVLYKKTYDNLFSNKNQWNLPDMVSSASFGKLDISYVISDYDINLKKQDIELNQNFLLPIVKSQPLKLSFTPSSENLSQIRFITANFNRLNTCSIQVSILDGKNVLTQLNVVAQDLRDSMFYTVNTGGVELQKGKDYILEIDSKNGTKNNCVALKGNSTIPFIQLLFSVGKTYPLLYKGKNIYIWGVPEVKNRIIPISNNRTVINYKSQKRITLDMLYFPGWVAYIDGRSTKIFNDDSFISTIVPAGKHVLSFEYKPLSFYFGFFISSFTLIGVVIYIVLQKKEWLLLKKRIWNKKAQRTRFTLSESFLITFFSLTIGIIIVILLNLFLLPKYIPLPKTTSINWLTRHNHSITLDYLRFILIILVIPSLIIFGWGVYIWKKNR